MGATRSPLRLLAPLLGLALSSRIIDPQPPSGNAVDVRTRSGHEVPLLASGRSPPKVSRPSPQEVDEPKTDTEEVELLAHSAGNLSKKFGGGVSLPSPGVGETTGRTLEVDAPLVHGAGSGGVVDVVTMLAREGRSPELAAVLRQIAALSESNRLELLAAMGAAPGGFDVAIRAWSQDDFVPPHSSAVPRRPSRQVPIVWERDDGDVTMSPSARSGLDSAVTGCPWCRRPVKVLGRLPAGFAEVAEPTGRASGGTPRSAYVTLLYGPKCHTYFLGALVLGHGLLRYGGRGTRVGGPPTDRVLLHTADVPAPYIAALQLAGWSCVEVEYINGVATNLFHNWRYSRFIDVFTKFRALQLVEFDKVLLLDNDMLVRRTSQMSSDVDFLESLFSLQAPAAMKRGPPVPRHGEEVPYSAIWSHITRRSGDALPPHQQASGINAGVMLLHPDADAFTQIEQEVKDWLHPEHYATYMPEQEYLSRFLGTFERWTHVSCRFNFEVDKNERVPHDFTEAHEAIRGVGVSHHPGAVVLHYSGTGIKPWDLLLATRGDALSMTTATASEVRPLLAQLQASGPGSRLDGYVDVDRLWVAMLEWMEQLADVAEALASQGCDVIALVREVAAEVSARKGAPAASD